MMNKTANDNHEWDQTELSREDRIYLPLKSEGMTEEEIDEAFNGLDEKVHQIVELLRRDQISDQQIDDAITEFRGIIEHPNYEKYQAALVKQRRRIEGSDE